MHTYIRRPTSLKLHSFFHTCIHTHTHIHRHLYVTIDGILEATFIHSHMQTQTHIHRHTYAMMASLKLIPPCRSESEKEKKGPGRHHGSAPRAPNSLFRVTRLSRRPESARRLLRASRRTDTTSCVCLRACYVCASVCLSVRMYVYIDRPFQLT